MLMSTFCWPPSTLTVPIASGNDWLALFAFIGGFSSATSMVIVASIALSIMLSNHVIMPILFIAAGFTWIAWREGSFPALGTARRALVWTTALLLAGMQTQKLMNGGTASFSDGYGLMVADVGTAARQAQNGSEVQSAVLRQSESEWASLAGVNLDEEAADLLRYQQAYQAAAQIISVADQIFQTLIGAVRS